MNESVNCYICKQQISLNSQEVTAVTLPMKSIGSDQVIEVNCCSHHNGVQELHNKTVQK